MSPGGGAGIAPQRLDHIHIPDVMQIGAFAPDGNLHLIAAPVVIVLGMQRLVHVGDEMDQEAQRFGAHAVTQLAVGQNAHVLFDLRHHAGVVRTIAPGIIAGRLKRNVDIMPRPGIAPLVADLVRPVGLQHQHRLAAQKMRRLRPRRRRQFVCCDKRRDLMAFRAPGRRALRRQSQQAGQRDEPWKISKVQ